jgi:hypothetical protein
MYRLHLTRNLRTLAFLLILSAVLGTVGVLWWANHTGLPEPWRAAIEREAAKQGVHLKIGGLRYIVFRGIVATDVRIYSEPEHLREFSRLERVVLGFDNTKLARGIIHLKKLQLDDARLVLAVDPKDLESETLDITDANGTVWMPGGRRLEIRDARGKIAGINVTLNARLIGYQQEGNKPPDESNEGKRRALLTKVINELKKWNFDRNHAPALRITAEGDINDHSSITAKIGLRISDIEKNGHVLDEVTAQADMAGDVLTVTSLRAADSRGVFEGHIDYNLRDREGRFDVSSSLEVPRLLTAWLGLPALHDVSTQTRRGAQTPWPARARIQRSNSHNKETLPIRRENRAVRARPHTWRCPWSRR